MGADGEQPEQRTYPLLPNERRPLLIAVDGLDGSGKSSLAAWLSWQLEMPVIHLEAGARQYLDCHSASVQVTAKCHIPPKS
jgi:adenylylsulfate kinase-like enzyme